MVDCSPSKGPSGHARPRTCAVAEASWPDSLARIRSTRAPPPLDARPWAQPAARAPEARRSRAERPSAAPRRQTGPAAALARDRRGNGAGKPSIHAGLGPGPGPTKTGGTAVGEGLDRSLDEPRAQRLSGLGIPALEGVRAARVYLKCGLRSGTRRPPQRPAITSPFPPIDPSHDPSLASSKHSVLHSPLARLTRVANELFSCTAHSLVGRMRAYPTSFVKACQGRP